MPHRPRIEQPIFALGVRAQPRRQVVRDVGIDEVQIGADAELLDPLPDLPVLFDVTARLQRMIERERRQQGALLLVEVRAQLAVEADPELVQAGRIVDARALAQLLEQRLDPVVMLGPDVRGDPLCLHRDLLEAHADAARHRLHA
jgi:hypothetical protein